MPSSYTPNNRFELQNPGENLNTWGSKLNADTTALIDSAIAGVTSIAPSGNLTLTTASGSADQARAAIINATSGTGGTITIPPVSKVYQVNNACSGGLIFTTGSGITATVEAGSLATVISDGTNCYRFADAADIATCLAAANAYALSLSFAASGGQLPGQGGNAGNFLTTNGSTALWSPITNAATATALASTQMFSVTGDVTAPSVNFNGTAPVALGTTLATSGVAPGTYTNPTVTFDAKGRATSASNGATATITAAVFTYSVSNGTGPDIGSLTISSWNKRHINTTVVGQSWASLTSNSITLAAGTYIVRYYQGWFYAGAGAGQVQGRFRDTTGGVSYGVTTGGALQGGSGAQVADTLTGEDVITLTGSHVFDVDIFPLASSIAGGLAVGTGENEIYVRVVIEKIA